MSQFQPPKTPVKQRSRKPLHQRHNLDVDMEDMCDLSPTLGTKKGRASLGSEFVTLDSQKTLVPISWPAKSVISATADRRRSGRLIKKETAVLDSDDRTTNPGLTSNDPSSLQSREFTSELDPFSTPFLYRINQVAAAASKEDAKENAPVFGIDFNSPSASPMKRNSNPNERFVIIPDSPCGNKREEEADAVTSHFLIEASSFAKANNLHSFILPSHQPLLIAENIPNYFISKPPSMASTESVLFPLISGTIPGVIDSSQRDRLLRTSSTMLCFASFDALTARVSNKKPNERGSGSAPSSSTLSDNPLSSDGKRVVVETDANTGICTWRFVPRAKMEFGVDHEGTWPRLVQLCGRVVRMTQDQWDIHKLDPEYECIVRVLPEITRIDRILPASDTSENIPFASSIPNPINQTPTHQSTARMEGTTPTPKSREPMPSSEETPSISRNYPTMNQDQLSPNHMAVDPDPHYFQFEPGQPTPKPMKLIRSITASTSNRRASSPLDLDSEQDIETETGPAKRSRVRDPMVSRQALNSKRARREWKRKAELDARLKARRDLLQNAFWDELGVPPDLRDPTYFSEPTEASPGPEEEDVFGDGNAASEASPGPEEEDVFGDARARAPSETTTTTETETEAEEDSEMIRQIKIEESRRKLADLERDKPLWEQAAQRRKEQELQNEEARRQEKIKQEEEERQRAAYKRYLEQWELEQQAHEREMRKRQKGSEMFVSTPVTRTGYRWSSRQALQRYTDTATRFDSAKYTSTTPLTFQSIPWPILSAAFSINEIEWQAVERFFEKARYNLPPEEFQELVEKSHKRFHPDRWRSRRILLSVEDELERDLLEVAGSTVAQALTPLWKQVTGRA